MGGSVGVFELIQKDRARTHTEPSFVNFWQRIMSLGTKLRTVLLEFTPKVDGFAPGAVHHSRTTSYSNGLVFLLFFPWNKYFIVECRSLKIPL